MASLLDLANGWTPDKASSQRRLLDGAIWTAKSMARDPTTGEYLLFAAYKTSAYSFTSQDHTKANS